MIPFVIGAAAIAVTASTACWIFNSMTEEEERRHTKIKNKIKEYGNKYETLYEQNRENQQKIEQEAFCAVKKEFLDQINFFKKEKRPIKDDLEKLKQVIENEINNESISPYVKKSLLFEKNRIEDAFKRLDAYWNYLKWYERQIQDWEQNKEYTEIFNNDQPDALLPNDFLYVGKLAKINENELNQWNDYGQKLELSSQKIADKVSQKQEIENLQYYTQNNITEVPIFINYVNKTNKFFKASIAKAELWQSLLTGSQIEAKPIYDERPNSNQIIVDYKGVRGFLPRKDKLFPLKNYRKTFPLKLKIFENDFLLRKIVFTEKLEIEKNKRNHNDIIIVFNKNTIDEELDKFSKRLQDFNLSVAQIDIEKAIISFKLSDLNIICKIEKAEGYLKIIKIDSVQIDSSKSFEPPYNFLFIPIETFDPGLYPSLDATLSNFIEFVNNQFLYIEYSRKNNAEDYNFFRKWNKALDYQIDAKSFAEEPYQCEDIKSDNGYVYFDLPEDQFKNIYDRISKLQNSKNRPIVSVECRLSNSDYFECIDIGKIDDINEEENKISVKVNIPSNDNIHFNSRMEFILKIPTFQSALLRQRNALKDFGIGKIVNSDLKTELISPQLINSTIDSNWDAIFTKNIKWQNVDLTENQKRTITKVLSEKNISLVQGPPGTGKTTIIKEIAYQQLKNRPGEKILIVSQQNVAVDNALSRIYQENKKWFDGSIYSFVRIAPSEDKVNEELKPFTIDNWFKDYQVKVKNNYKQLLYETPSMEEYCKEWWGLIDKKELREVDNEIIEILVNSHNIIGATCVGLANRSIGLDLIEFDIAIIDEAGRATPPELLIPILRAKKIVLIGDHYQLPPQYDRKLLDAIENDDDDNLNSFDKEFFEKSFFERLYDSLPDTNKSMLTDQFRMPKEVGSLVSKIFYNETLQNGLEKQTTNFYNPDRIIEWVDVQGRQEYDGTSSYNEKEVKDISLLIDDIESHLVENKTVAIITPYSAQKRRLRKKISKLKLKQIYNIKIDTIDSFQGEEAQIVIYSTVRTKGNLSFLIDRKRLNVAISRTQENLIFVGHKNFLKNAKVKGKTNLFNKIISYIDNINGT